MSRHCSFFLFVFLVAAMWACGSANGWHPKGVGPKTLSHFEGQKESKEFLCLDGKQVIPRMRVNDDFCDCADGSDEPGTSACAGRGVEAQMGGFWCQNKGHMGWYISLSKVVDGICDCCDGSDEVDGQCENTCQSLADEERRMSEESMRVLLSGLKQREGYLATATKELSEKRKELAGKRGTKEEIKKALSALEEELTLKEAAEVVPEESGSVDVQVEEGTKDGDVGTDHDDPSDSDGERHVEDDNHNHEDSEEGAIESDDSWFGRSREVILRVIGMKKKRKTVYESELESQKEKVEEKKRELSDIESEEEALRKVAETDFGPSDVFYPLEGKRFVLKTREYEYELNMFGEVVQKDRSNGHKIATMGKFGKWDSYSDQSPSLVQHYKDGDTCWNGPRRSLTLNIECGDRNEWLSVEEPSRCTYEGKFISPAACVHL
jgi:protein kinase C substrate 80K-H